MPGSVSNWKWLTKEQKCSLHILHVFNIKENNLYHKIEKTQHKTQTENNNIWISYLSIFVFVSKVQEPVVSFNGFWKLPNISAGENIVFPDLPVFVVAFQSFL